MFDHLGEHHFAYSLLAHKAFQPVNSYLIEYRIAPRRSSLKKVMYILKSEDPWDNFVRHLIAISCPILSILQ